MAAAVRVTEAASHTPLLTARVVEAWPNTDTDEVYVLGGDRIDCFAPCYGAIGKWKLDYQVGEPVGLYPALPYSNWLHAQRVNLFGPFTFVCTRWLASKWWGTQNPALKWALFILVLLGLILFAVIDILIIFGLIVRAVIFPLSFLCCAPFFACSTRHLKGSKWCCVLSTLLLRGSSGGDGVVMFGLLGRVLLCPALACRPWPTKDNPDIDYCC